MSASIKKKPTRVVFVGVGGSTGKTTQATSLACELARRGKKVRYLDGDQQGDGSRLMRYEDAPLVLADVLGEEKVFTDPETGAKRAPTMREIEQPYVRGSAEEAEERGGYFPETAEEAEWMARITVVPSGVGVNGSELGDAITKMDRLPGGMGSMKIMAAFEQLDQNRPDDEIPDVEIMDLAGNKQTMTYFGLRWAAQGGDQHGPSGVFAVVTPDEKSCGAHLRRVFTLTAQVAEFAPGLEVRAIIPVRTKKPSQGKFYADKLEEIRNDEEFGHLVTPGVREAVYAPEAYERAISLFSWVPKEAVTADQVRVVDWLVENKVLVI